MQTSVGVTLSSVISAMFELINRYEVKMKQFM